MHCLYCEHDTLVEGDYRCVASTVQEGLRPSPPSLPQTTEGARDVGHVSAVTVSRKGFL